VFCTYSESRTAHIKGSVHRRPHSSMPIFGGATLSPPTQWAAGAPRLPTRRNLWRATRPRVDEDSHGRCSSVLCATHMCGDKYSARCSVLAGGRRWARMQHGRLRHVDAGQSPATGRAPYANCPSPPALSSSSMAPALPAPPRSHPAIARAFLSTRVITYTEPPIGLCVANARPPPPWPGGPVAQRAVPGLAERKSV